jgi:conjugal transfer pilus assembly protein TraU
MKKPYQNKFAVAVLVAALTQSSIAWGKSEIYGNVYDIAEPDALKEIMNQAGKVDPKTLLEDRENWTAFKGVPLPVAEKDSKRHYIPWHVNDMEITGPDGKLLYPRGFRFNPLQYARLPQRIVVFKKGQEKLISPYLKEGDMLIMDAGDVVEAGNDMGRHIFILDQKMKERLDIRRAPSFIWQEKYHLVIQELGVKNEITD